MNRCRPILRKYATILQEQFSRLTVTEVSRHKLLLPDFNIKMNQNRFSAEVCPKPLSNLQRSSKEGRRRKGRGKEKSER